MTKSPQLRPSTRSSGEKSVTERAHSAERAVRIEARRLWLPGLSDENLEEQVTDWLREHRFTVDRVEVLCRDAVPESLLTEVARLRSALREIARAADVLQADPVMPVTEGLRIRDRALSALGLRGQAAIEALR